MPRGGGAVAGGASRGKKNYKGQRRHFTDENELKEQAKKTEREREWRRQHGVPSDHEEEGDDEAKAKNRDMPPSDSESSSEESSEEDELAKPKGVAHLIEIENPNRVGSKSTKKVTEMGEGAATGLSRREREEIQKQEAHKRYQALHLAGKTDEAQADLARLAIIRKNREEATKKREEEKMREAEKSKSKS